MKGLVLTSLAGFMAWGLIWYWQDIETWLWLRSLRSEQGQHQLMQAHGYAPRYATPTPAPTPVPAPQT